MDKLPKTGIYRHYKGNFYRLLYIAHHSETMELMVVYQALYGDGDVWVRPLSMWDEMVTNDEYTGARFTYVGE